MTATTQPTPGRSAATIAGVLATMVVSAYVALRPVLNERAMVPLEPRETPHGYTWSLLLFLIPAAVLGIWFHRNPKYRLDRKSFWAATAFLFSLGAALDVLFAESFFTFKNAGATLGIQVPVVGGKVPIEEFAFYGLGFMAILLTYIWCNEYWLNRYHKLEHAKEHAHPARSLVSIHGHSVVFGLLVVVAAVLWKKFGPHEYHEGFPGYFLFLLAVGVAPNVLFFRAVGKHINWRALCFTAMLLLPISLLWEGVLAVPYQWWGYQDRMMLGIKIHAMSGLPIEAVLLWLVVAYAGVTFYEVIRLWRGVRSAYD